jgi:flagellar basal-body rod protein FlgG
MHPALWISKTGLDAQQTDIAVISNNLANASTVGYKKSRAVFEDLLYQNINQPGGRSSQDTEMPNGLMVGAGTKVVATQKNFSQGNMTTTENSLDFMIQGKGFFRNSTPRWNTSLHP